MRRSLQENKTANWAWHLGPSHANSLSSQTPQLAAKISILRSIMKKSMEVFTNFLFTLDISVMPVLPLEIFKAFCCYSLLHHICLRDTYAHVASIYLPIQEFHLRWWTYCDDEIGLMKSLPYCNVSSQFRRSIWTEEFEGSMNLEGLSFWMVS